MRKITEFDIKICKENVLHLIDCYEDSELYEAVSEEYEEMLPQAYKMIEPIAILEFGSIAGLAVTDQEITTEQALFSLTSVGGKLSAWSTELFGQGDYLRGMLADAIADDYLFQMDHQISGTVIEMCKEQNYGVKVRLEAPQDISMEAQKRVYDTTKAEAVGIKIKESFMYDPVKTTCQIYVLDQDQERFRIEHNCRTCPNVNCKMRHVAVTLTVRTQGREQQVVGESGQTVMEILKENDIYLDAVCAGKGRCGKCGVIVTGADVEIAPADREFFSETQLAAGHRLACLAKVTEDCVITIDSKSSDGFAVVTAYESDSEETIEADTTGMIAVDIGTTTIGMQLLSGKSGAVLDTYAGMNGQRAYGADVISRIEASNSGNGSELRQIIEADLQQGITYLTKDGQIPTQKMVIGANTTMVHLLMGYSCETLGVAPFTPVNIETIQTNLGGIDTTIFPGISTYVGGDITAGLLALDFDRSDEVSVLVDLGTNGEMAIGTKDRILVASTAAGPAFEGGNIICGTGSIPGAISGVTFTDDQISLQTIGDQPPRGICGTGVVDIVYELVKAEWCDETGLLEDEYFEDGVELAKDENGQAICFYQKDVREIQLAKSAVRAGLETLVRRYGVTWDEVKHIYVAGGFGYHMNIEKAIGIGLLPEECAGRIDTVGNTCLKGAGIYLRDPKAAERVAAIRANTTEIPLSTDKDFNEFYMEYMYFE